jgi:hypothetical protein
MRAGVPFRVWRPHALLLLCLPCCALENPVAVAYSSAGSLSLSTASGKIVKTFRTKPAIGNFAISADASTVVFIPLGAKPNGGPLYRLDTTSGRTRRLRTRPAYVKGEVYADPDISPDGHHAVFAIHATATGDAVGAAGPFATMNLNTGDLNTGEINVLNATRMWGGVEPVFGKSPRWSPDGKRILLNVEGTFAIAGAAGASKQEMGRVTESGPTDERATFGISWLGNNCVAYIYYSGRDDAEFKRAPAHILNLRTLEKQPAEALLGAAMPGLADIAWPLRARYDGDGVVIEGPAGSWTVPAHDAIVRLLPRPSDKIPDACK